MADDVAMGGYQGLDETPLIREGSPKPPMKRLVIIGISVAAVVLLIVVLATTIPSSSNSTGQNQRVEANQTSPTTKPPSSPVSAPTSPVSAPTQGNSPTLPGTTPNPTPMPTTQTVAPTSAPVKLEICTACAQPLTSVDFQVGCFVDCAREPEVYDYCTSCAAEGYTPVTGSACDINIRDWASRSCPNAPTNAPTPAPTSYIPYDPRSPSVSYGLKFLCLGDWGVTNDGDHVSTTSGKKSDPVVYQRNFDAQKNVAKYLTDWAKANSPAFVLSHGDNFYWTGVNTKSDDRFRTVFEQMYSDPSLFVPWYNVLGNHDVGGGSGFCGPSCWSCGTRCDTTDNMMKALAAKVNAQKNYVSPNNNRWVFEGHYYKKKHYFPSTATNDADAEYSVEIFNIDTNAAGDRLPQTCCQCFGAASSDACKNPSPGVEPGCINMEMYSACANEITGWWNDAMTQLERDLAQSNATWKIVHNHYLMRYHFSAPQQDQVRRILKDYKVHMFIGGHRHAEGHELVDFTHHIENGGGGGAHNSGGCGGGVAAGCIWSSNTYGFMGVKLSKYYMRVEFINDYGAKMHCYHIPVDHSDDINNNGKWNWCT